jgi:hypothetical protein
LINLISQEDKLNAALDAMDHYLVGQILSPRSTDSSKYKKFLSENVSELKNYKKLSGYADYELYDRAVMAPVKIMISILCMVQEMILPNRSLSILTVLSAKL